jgi:type III pantothenate kinase
MNIIAIDIGNTNISIGLYVDDSEKYIKTIDGSDTEKLKSVLVDAWEEMPYSAFSTENKRDGIIVVSSVKDEWTKVINDICNEHFDESVRVIGKDIPIPIETGVEDSMAVGTDRLVSAAAAFAVVQDAVIVADIGTALTIDLVDDDGVFLGGVICPGFDLAAEALANGTAKLPKVTVSKPKSSIGTNTVDSINSGLYYSVVGVLRTIAENYASELEKWPQMIVTGGCAEMIKDSCDFVDSWVKNLAVKGVVLTYKKYIDDKAQEDEPDIEEE